MDWVGQPWTFEEAACAGRLDVLRWLREVEGCSWNSTSRRCGLCDYVAHYGHWDVLEWLNANGCPWTASTLNSAVQHGHEDMVHRLIAAGCPWGNDGSTLNYAVLQNDFFVPPQTLAQDSLGLGAPRANQEVYLRLVQWLHAQGCPWCEFLSCQYAVIFGRLEILRWLRSQDPPCSWDRHLLCSMAEAYERWPMLHWLLVQEPTPFSYVVHAENAKGSVRARPEHYCARKYLSTEYQKVWSTATARWMETVQDLATTLWPAVLCPDLVQLVLQYC